LSGNDVRRRPGVAAAELAVVTVVLAMGVQRMARRGAIVRKLPAVETLGSATVIASDKTGTLTRNEMTVRVIVTAAGRVDVTGTGYSPDGDLRTEGGKELSGDWKTETDRLLQAAALANNAQLTERDGSWSIQGDPTEAALLVAAAKAGIDHGAIQARFPRLAEAPFSSERKRMSTVHQDAESPGGRLVFSKGAPGMLLERCTQELTGKETRPLAPARRAQILSVTEALAAEAFRTLGAAFRSLDPGDSAGTPNASADEFQRDLVFLGLIGMIDPPRPEARAAVGRAKAAGIRPILITGDHAGTAVAIARELGIASDDRVISGAQLDGMSDKDLAAAAREVAVYARVNPKHKLRIVNALQRNGEVVAMTGDGVNDARHSVPPTSEWPEHHRYGRIEGRRSGADRQSSPPSSRRLKDARFRKHPEIPALSSVVECERVDGFLLGGAGRSLGAAARHAGIAAAATRSSGSIVTNEPRARLGVDPAARI
jgi:Ca2+-transporting ATPase